MYLKGSFFLAQKAAQKMIETEQKGRILLMSSVTGFTFYPDLIAYGISKAALAFLAKNLGVELATHQITVNAIAPGATTEDIAYTAPFLLSDEAQHITGQTLIVDGGWTSTSPPP